MGPTKGSGMQEISTDELAAKLEQESAVLVDVREPDEFEGGRIPGARNIPMSQLSDALGDFDRAVPIHLVCATGNRSGVMTEVLVDAGFDALNVAGGTVAWTEAGRPVESGVSR